MTKTTNMRFLIHGGVLGVMYNTKKVREGEIKSWNDLLKKKYDQQIVMPDSVRDNFAIALKARGYSINTKKESELKEATKVSSKIKVLLSTSTQTTQQET